MVALGNRRSSAPTLRRRGRTLSEATLLRMLFVMLGVIFVLYASLMIIIARYTHSYHPSLRTPATDGNTFKNTHVHADNDVFAHHVVKDAATAESAAKIEDPDASPMAKQMHRDLRPPQQQLRVPDQEHTQNIDQDSNNPQHNGGDAQEWTDRTLKAFIEPIDQASWEVKPLPIRTTAQASKLNQVPFPQLNSCSRLTEQWPVDEYPEADPFLPWIHDVFPTEDGKYIQFVAQNKRRCDTGKSETDRAKIMHRQPQVALFQHVPLKRVEGGRYRLSSHEEADADAMETRFICRFKPSMEETLSVHNINYDYVSYRKNHKQSFTQLGKWDLKSLHTTQLIFRCPVPEHLQDTVRDGSSVVDDFATMFVDVIPIRTPPRYGPPDTFFPPRYAEFINTTSEFKPDIEWGDSHILPKIEDSGRWENIPICKPSLMAYDPEALAREKEQQKKAHRLISCVWASAGYATRGERFSISDGQRRLREWLHYVFVIGFDHVFVYDNSGAHSNETSLKSITDEFPGKVTRLVWPSNVCNNNRNFADSPGERSSQYAAESSCRLRFGPHTDWLGQFDIDEYLSPQGKYDSVPQLLDKLEDEGKKIVSFGSWRAWPRRIMIEEPVVINNRSICDVPEPCFQLKVRPEKTLLQTYNCDRQRGQKKEKMPAEKQIYRPDYVKLHFVHYSTVTNLTLMNKEETKAFGQPWKKKLAADPLSRFGDELTEGNMLHTKAIATQDTAGWLDACKEKGHQMCRIGNPYPEGAEKSGKIADDEGWTYNCYVNEKIENHYVPLLEKSMKLSSS